jgi:hypothetical protein
MITGKRLASFARSKSAAKKIVEMRNAELLTTAANRIPRR